MKFIGKFIFHIFSNAIAILAAAHFISGFKFNGNFLELLLVSLILTAINTFIRPILKLLLGPLIVLTFGLFLVVLNAVSLYLLDLWSKPLTIESYAALFLSSVLIGFVNFLVAFSAKRISSKN